MEMFIGLVAVLLIFGSIPALILYFLYSRHKVKMDMLSRGVNPAQFSAPPSPRSGNATLLLGLLGVFTGLSFIISAVLVQKNFDRDLMTVGIMFIFTGAAFITYWKMTAHERESARRIQEQHYTWLLEQSKHPFSETENVSTDEDQDV